MTPMSALHKCFMSIACALLVFTANAQTPAPITFGQVDLKDLEMTSYPQDTAAVAVILCDYGDYSYDFSKPEPLVSIKRHVRIKILKKGGLVYANQKIPYFFSIDPNRTEVVKNLKASTWNLENGAKEWNKIEDKDFFEEKASNDVYYKTFTFPQVKEGSVLEYTYEIESGLWYRLPDWNFQTNIPTLWSELRAEIPSYFEYNITLHSLLPLKIQGTREGSDHFMRSRVYDPYLAYTFAMEDVPALKNEPFITTLENYRSKLNFELAVTHFPYQGTRNYTQTWEQLNETLLKNDYFGKQIERYDEAKVIAKELKTTAKDALSLLKTAYRYVQNRMQWNGENSLFTSKTNLNKVAEVHLGNAAEINLMLVRLLRECGFDANPMILSTRDHGLPTDLVLLDRFNFTIAHVDLDGEEILLDASNKYIQFGMLPFQCLNEKGRLVVKDNSRWVEIPNIQVSRKISSIDASIFPEQKVSGNVKFSYEGKEALALRTSVHQKGKDAFVRSLKKANPNQSVTKIDLVGIDSLEANPEVNIQTTYNEAYTTAGEFIYFTPMLDLGEVNNPFKSPTRYYPVEFGVPQEEIFSAVFKIPADYMVEEVPKGSSVTLLDDGGRFDFRVNISEKEITVNSKITLKKTTYSSKEYLSLREFYNRIIAKHAEQIVLKRK